MKGSFDINNIFEIKNFADFENCALDIFKFQYAQNPVYQQFVNNLGRKIDFVNHIDDIPFLPIELFKSHDIICKNFSPQIIFRSSGTTGMAQSQHLIADLSIYERSFFKAFCQFIGNPKNCIILGLLPSYLERQGSSLIYMVKDLINRSESESSGFFLNEFDKLESIIQHSAGKKVILFGVTYALIDFGEFIHQKYPDLIIIETGGMKGRRKEISKTELYELYKNLYGVKNIYSEYGMTELLSQAYSLGDAKYFCPNWMKIKIRELNDPFSYEPNGKSGGINIIDLANVYSCSFIETKDQGKLLADGSFQILGRIDNTDIRGCNLLVQ